MRAVAHTLLLRASLAALCVAAACGSDARSQCGPGGCPIGPRSPGITIPGPHAAPRPAPVLPGPQTAPQPQEEGLPETINRKTLVHIFSDIGRGQARGTGAIVTYRDEKFIVTARHVVASAHSVQVKAHDGRVAEAAVLEQDRVYDVAVLGLPSSFGDLPAIELANRHPQSGELLQSAGFGGRDWPGWRNGRFMGWRSPPQSNAPSDWFVISVPAEPGDSGGPIVDREGKLMGVLWGTDGASTVATQVGRVAKTLETCWLRRRPPHATPTPQPQPPQNTPTLPPEPPQVEPQKPEAPKPEPPKPEAPKPEPPKPEGISPWWMFAPAGFLLLFLVSAVVSQFTYRMFSKQS